MPMGGKSVRSCKRKEAVSAMSVKLKGVYLNSLSAHSTIVEILVMTRGRKVNW